MQTNNKLREAVEAVVKVGYPHNFQREAPHIREYCYEITTAIKKCLDALAVPPRNCDIGTAEEQIERWRKFCHKFEECCECPHMRNSELLSHGCFARWSQMPYEEGCKK